MRPLKNGIVPICLLLAICACMPQLPPTDPSVMESMKSDNKPIVVGIGDELEVGVWRYDDLSKTVTIDQDGNIFLPMAGEIYVTGMTPSEIRKVITEKYTGYIKDPQVSVRVSLQASQKVYVFGEVREPGFVSLKRKMNFLEVLSNVGGFTNNANSKSVLLARLEDNKPKVVVINANLKSAFGNNDFSWNLPLRPDDVIYVIPKVIADVEETAIRINNIVNALLNIERTITFVPQVIDVLETGETKTNTTISF